MVSEGLEESGARCLARLVAGRVIEFGFHAAAEARRAASLGGMLDSLLTCFTLAGYSVGLVTLTTKRRKRERSVLRQAMTATATLQASNACSLKNRCVEAVVR